MLSYDSAYAVLHDPDFDAKTFVGRDDFSDEEIVDVIRRNPSEVLEYNVRLCRYLLEDENLWISIAEVIPVTFHYRKFVDHFMMKIATSRHYNANIAFRVLKARLEEHDGAPYDVLRWSKELSEDQIAMVQEKERKVGGG